MAASASAVKKVVKIPKNYCCSITSQIMAEPVFAADGHTYEREAIEEWLKTHDTSPKTNQKLKHKELTLNLGKRGEISEFLDRNPDLYENRIYLPRSWIRELVATIKANKIKEVQEWLTKDRRLLTLKLEGDYTAFHLACQFGSAELANILFESLTRRNIFARILKQPPAGFNPIHLNIVLKSQEQASRIEQLEKELVKEKKIVKDQADQIHRQTKQLEQQASRIKQLEKELAQMKQRGGPEEDSKERGEQQGFIASQAAASVGPLQSLITHQYQVKPKPTPKVDIKVNAEEVQKFLDNVAAGAQPEAEAMLKANQDLALVAGTVADHAERTFRNITGFQYAAWALDWQMWKMIRKYLPIEAAREQAKGFNQGEWIAEHGEQVSWKKVIDTLQTLLDNWSVWDLKKIDEYWIQQVGGAQRLLPMHVLQQYAQWGRPFYPCPNFAADYDLTREKPHWVSQLGVSVAIYRGAGPYARSGGREKWWAAWRPGIQYHGHSDIVALKACLKSRTQQRAELLAELVKDRGFSRLSNE